MKLSQLAAKPQLVKITLDSAEIVQEYGEPVEFYTWDRQPLEVFMKLANSSSADGASMINIVRTMILNEDGTQIITDEHMLPTNILVEAISRLTATLGKS
jgi:hypothetical protein